MDFLYSTENVCECKKLKRAKKQKTFDFKKP